MKLTPFYFLLLFISCSNFEKAEGQRIRKQNAIAEPIVRFAEDATEATAPYFTKREAYPWEETLVGHFPRITKEHFRCQGSSRNPPVNEGDRNIFDCSGGHSLPIKEDKEFVWPQLIAILNDIQAKTGQRVVVTCGHRCPVHNTYADPSVYNQTSKHQIGAEVDFYVENMDAHDVIQLILDRYGPETFRRYEKQNVNVRTPPWFNREIFIKLYEADEGRDLDNTHGLPYISIQMRYDIENDEWISYSWDKAFRSYYRE